MHTWHCRYSLMCLLQVILDFLKSLRVLKKMFITCNCSLSRAFTMGWWKGLIKGRPFISNLYPLYQVFQALKLMVNSLFPSFFCFCLLLFLASSSSNSSCFAAFSSIFFSFLLMLLLFLLLHLPLLSSSCFLLFLLSLFLHSSKRLLWWLLFLPVSVSFSSSVALSRLHCSSLSRSLAVSTCVSVSVSGLIAVAVCRR